jgi:CBS domain-containing protein
VNADDDVARVVDLMRETTHKSLPVLLRGRVVGVISRRDVVRAIAHGELDARSADELSPA